MHPEASTAAEAENREDERLVGRAQTGDLEAFNALVVRHERAVYNLALRLLRDAPQAEDATQDTFIRAWRAIGSFRGGLVRPWLLRIATNRAYDLLRARVRRPTHSLDAEAYEVEPAWTSQIAIAEHPEAFAARVELSEHLEAALASLPDDQRLAIMLSDIHGYGYEEIARISDVAIGTVKSRISRGRARLRTLLTVALAAREPYAPAARLPDEQPEALR